VTFLFSILPLFSIAYQDFKQRAISWYWPVLLLAISAFAGWSLYEGEMFKNIAFNLAFLVILFSTVTVYFSLKAKKLTNIFDVFIGWGDVVFLLALVPFFHPLDFVLFYTFSTILALVVALVLKGKEIPYAGILSALMIVVFVVGFITDTTWLINLQFKSLLF
jgi:hypothetical protein